MWQLILISLGSFVATSDSSPLLVKTDKGSIRGSRHRVLGNKIVNEYLGIPFAKPPVGDLRFQKPVSNGAWNGVYNATNKPSSCWQTEDIAFGDFPGSTMWNSNTQMSEDCLYLNVWVPVPTTSSKKLPVMVWIFGGGFYYGSSTLDLYDGKYLAAAGEVIIVSMNYRVGMLGFLALPGRTDAPGNMGLFDQLMALEWVNKNIDAFGGDLDSITLFGESSGSVSVSLHLLSPLSKHMFHRAVLQSGSALAEWTMMSADNANYRYKKVFPKLNCVYDSDVEALAACLRSKSASDINANEFFTSDLVQFPFLPVVDNDFLLETPRAAIENGHFKKCPLLIGSNGNEGSFFAAYLPVFETSFNLSEIDFTIGQLMFRELIQHSFESYPQWPQPLTSFALDAIVYRYTDWLRPDATASNLAGINDALGDYHFVCPVSDWADEYVRHGQTVYYYHYTHLSSRKHWGRWTGAMHADEINYIFGEPLRPNMQYTDEEKEFSKQMIDAWTQFSKFGNPNGYFSNGSLSTRWPPRTLAKHEYYELFPAALRSTSGVVSSGPRLEYCAFWTKYMPSLVTSTADVNEVEREWKLQFHDWKSRYMVDWRNQYQAYMKNNEQSCKEVRTERMKP